MIRIPTHRAPTHPGEMLRAEFLEPLALTQRELAKRIRTTASVICRLEDADYEGHTISMVRRIATALNRRLEFIAVPIKGHTRKAS